MAETQQFPLGMREVIPCPRTYIAEALVEHGVRIACGVQGGHIWANVSLGSGGCSTDADA